jgi:chromosomal replication initiation ATPase DnaA
VEPERIIRVICEIYQVEREDLLRRGYKGVGRGVLMEMLYRYGGMNQREIGQLMGIDYSAVSVMRKRLSGLQEKDRQLAAEMGRVKKRIELRQE